MFCLMDASASMTEPLKDLAKRFFMLLHVFLMRYYREVHIVFIRHTSTAAEVDEETFFRGTETGGTVISTALDEMLRSCASAIRRPTGTSTRRRPPTATTSTTTCRAAWSCSTRRSCRSASISPTSRRRTASASTTRSETPVWHGYAEVARRRRNFAMRRVAAPEDIFPVFHELFSASGVARLRRQFELATARSSQAQGNMRPCSTGRSGASS